jgi:hypothetical protein
LFDGNTIRKNSNRKIQEQSSIKLSLQVKLIGINMPNTIELGGHGMTALPTPLRC